MDKRETEELKCKSQTSLSWLSVLVFTYRGRRCCYSPRSGVRILKKERREGAPASILSLPFSEIDEPRTFKLLRKISSIPLPTISPSLLQHPQLHPSPLPSLGRYLYYQRHIIPRLSPLCRQTSGKISPCSTPLDSGFKTQDSTPVWSRSSSRRFQIIRFCFI